MAEPHPMVLSDSGKAAIRHLTTQGLIYLNTDTEGEYRCTNKGNAHVNQLLNVPLPKETWVNYEGKMIEWRSPQLQLLRQ